MAKLQSPGTFLTQLLEENKLNPFRLSKDIHLSQSAVRLIALGKTRVSVPVALRLSKYFGTSPEFWLMMQMEWDVAEAARDKDLTNIIKNIPRFKKNPVSGKPAASKTAKAGKRVKVTAK